MNGGEEEPIKTKSLTNGTQKFDEVLKDDKVLHKLKENLLDKLTTEYKKGQDELVKKVEELKNNADAKEGEPLLTKIKKLTTKEIVDSIVDVYEEHFQTKIPESMKKDYRKALDQAWQEGKFQALHLGGCRTTVVIKTDTTINLESGKATGKTSISDDAPKKSLKHIQKRKQELNTQLNKAERLNKVQGMQAGSEWDESNLQSHVDIKNSDGWKIKKDDYEKLSKNVLQNPNRIFTFNNQNGFSKYGFYKVVDGKEYFSIIDPIKYQIDSLSEITIDGYTDKFLEIK